MAKEMDHNLLARQAPRLSPEAIARLRRRLGPLHPEQIRAWQKMSPARRIEIACQAYTMTLQIVRLSERRQRPELSQDELDWHVTRRMQHNRRLGR